jgi:hypothetical protein
MNINKNVIPQSVDSIAAVLDFITGHFRTVFDSNRTKTNIRSAAGLDVVNLEFYLRHNSTEQLDEDKYMVVWIRNPTSNYMEVYFGDNPIPFSNTKDLYIAVSRAIIYLLD